MKMDGYISFLFKLIYKGIYSKGDIAYDILQGYEFFITDGTLINIGTRAVIGRVFEVTIKELN
jgi:hypothetical protein